MKLIGHRGFADISPENTLRAFQNTPEYTDMVELDLRRCRSGEIVVIHDGIVDAVTNSRGRVSHLTASELANLDILESGQGVPTLTGVLAVIPSGVGLNLELKERGLARDVVDAIKGREADIVISSANKGTLQEVRGVDSTIPTAFIFAMNPRKNLEIAEKLGCTHVQPHWGICISTNLIERAHEKGMEAYVWSITSDVGAQLLRRLGADGVIADKPVFVDQPSAFFSRRSPIFSQHSVQNVEVMFLPIALRTVAYPLVVLGACCTVVGSCSRMVPIDTIEHGRVYASIAQYGSTAKRELSVLLWKGKAMATTSDGRWRGHQQLASAKKLASGLFMRGVGSARYPESEPVARVNELRNSALSTSLYIVRSATDTIRDMLASGGNAKCWSGTDANGLSVIERRRNR